MNLLQGAHVKSFEKKYKQLKARPKTIHSTSYILEENENDKKDEEIFHSQPSILVAIDTSGANFERMSLYRRSLKDSDPDDVESRKKKKRRRTVSGVPDILNEIKKFEDKQRIITGGHRQPRAYSCDDLEVRDEGMLKYLDEIDSKIEERMEEERAMKTPKLMKLFPCRRTKSLPRCAKLSGLGKYSEKRPVSSISSGYGNSSLNSSSTSLGSRLSRSTKRSSIIGSKLKLLVTGVYKDKEKDKPRPKSLDLDAIDFSSNEKSNLSKVRAPSMPEGVLYRPQNSQAVGPGSYYSMESNTLPRARVKNHDFPWENLPKDWTTSVKLREISKRRSIEDRQSSSGNIHLILH